MVASIFVGPRFIGFLRRNEFGQHIREEMPVGHVTKKGTPTMGGLLLLATAAVGFLLASAGKFTVPALTVLFVTLACGAVGFMDDFIKLTHRRSLGLSGRWKLLLLAGITVGFAIEALSVIVQVFAFKYLGGRRPFLMAPIHYHFEMKAWSETKIMVRFWIVTGLLCAAAFALYYRYFRGFS